MEMGASNMQNAAETPIPETPPNGPAVNFGVGSQGGSCFGQSFAPGLVGNAPNLACAGNLAGAPNLASVQNLANFQNLPAPQQCFGAPGFQGFQNVGCCGASPVAGAPCPQGSSCGICQGCRGMMPPGGLTPQASVIRQVADLVGQLDPHQTRELQVILQERLTGQSRMIPEYFGEMPRGQRGSGFFGEGPSLPGLPSSGVVDSGDSWNGGKPLDVFAKTEKWLTPAPVPDTG